MKHMVTNWQTPAFGLVVPTLYALKFAGVPGLDFLPPFAQELPLVLTFDDNDRVQLLQTRHDGGSIGTRLGHNQFFSLAPNPDMNHSDGSQFNDSMCSAQYLVVRGASFSHFNGGFLDELTADQAIS